MSPGIRDMVGRLPYAPGVYRFRDRQGRIAYVGRATELRSRVASYWGRCATAGTSRRWWPA